MSINYIDISGVNCWIVNLIPFANRSDKIIGEYQLKCVEKKIFGMGWNGKNSLFNAQVELNQESVKIFLEACKEENDKNNIEQCLSKYLLIKPDDYAIMRLKNSHYYIGKVTSNAYYCNGEDDENKRLSWCCNVEEWVEFSSITMISEICGRFSKQYQQTIERVDSYRLRLLILKLYNSNCISPIKNYKLIPKIKLMKNNFCSSLFHTELEDLVCFYIYSKYKEDGYFIIPSSCKINQQKFEFSFITNKEEMKPISCQVKNQNSIHIEDYKNEISFDKIYLFSGLWTEGDVINYKTQYSNNDYKNIVFISPSDLFESLKEFIYFNDKMNEYYKFEYLNEGVLPPKLLFKARFSKSKNINEIQFVKHKNDERIYLNSIYLYYSDEFSSLIKDGDVYDSDVKLAKEILNKKIANS